MDKNPSEKSPSNIKTSRMGGTIKAILILLSVFLVIVSYGVGLILLNKYFGKKTTLEDPTKPDPEFVPKVDHFTFRKEPEKYSGPEFKEGNPEEAKKSALPFLARIDFMVENMASDHWRSLPEEYFTTEVTSELNYINIYTLLYADQIKLKYNTDIFLPEDYHLQFLEYGCPLKEGSTRPPNISDALHTMMWSLRVQHHMDRIFRHRSTPFNDMKRLSDSLSTCAERWKAASIASKDDSKDHYMQEVYKWLTTPLTNLMYEMATSPVGYIRLFVQSSLGYNLSLPSFTYPSSRNSHGFNSPASKAEIASSRADDVSRQEALSFLKICGSSGPYCYQGPVWYKQAMQRFLMLFEKVAGKDFRYTWWMEHLLQVLPYHMVGPWAEDYFIANCTEFTGTQASNWAYWSRRNGNSNLRVYDIALRNIHIKKNDYPPRRDVVAEKIGTSSLPQIYRMLDPSSGATFECPVERLTAKKSEKRAGGEEEEVGGKNIGAAQPIEGIDDAAYYFEKFTKCFDYYLQEIEAHFDGSMKVEYQGLAEAGTDQLGILKGFLADYMKCFASNELGIFTEISEGVVDLVSRKDPYFIELFAVLIAKFFQAESRPPVYFSEELNKLLMSVEPPSAEECIEYAYHHFDDVGYFIKNGQPDPNIDYRWEPSIPTIKYKDTTTRNPVFRTVFGVKTAGLDFGCGASYPIIDEEIVEYNRRVLIHFEWYMKGLRQNFQDSFYWYLTGTGLAYFNPSWMMRQSGPPPQDMPGLLACLYDENCRDLPQLKDSEGNSYDYLEALKKALVDLNAYKEFLRLVTNALAPPPGGFSKGYIKIHCKNERSPTGGYKLPFAHTCHRILDLFKYESYEELKLSLKVVLDYVNESKYGERGFQPGEKIIED